MPRLLTVHPDPTDLGTGSPTSSTFLDGTGAWAAIDIPAGVLTAVKTFYAASSSGGTVNVLNTVTIVDGYITGWTQTAPSGSPAGWLFNDAANSGHALLATFD